MAVKLTLFFAKLATDPREYARFLKDHEAYMRKAGLSKTHQKVVKSMNRKKIEAALRKEQKGPVQRYMQMPPGIILCILMLRSPPLP